MNDLSHWDFAENFLGFEAAALILGLDPSESAGDEHRVRVVMERLELDYSRAVEGAWAEHIPFDVLSRGTSRVDDFLVSVELDQLWRDASEGRDAPLDAWLADKRKPQFGNQKFSRNAIAAWLKAIGMKSGYHFDMQAGDSVTGDQDDVDPSDLPNELQAANIAYRAVLNGYGASSATFRNRLIEFLNKNNPDLPQEAVERIATVANPDKQRGRKKSQHK